MNKKSKSNPTKIVQGTFGPMREVKDFLPPPEELILKDDQKVKVTIMLSKKSINFFKHQAKQLGSSYQLMIRNLVDQYASQHKFASS